MPPKLPFAGAARYTHLGMTFAVSVLGGFFLGWWIDDKLETRPWLALAGAFIGATGGFIYLVRTLIQLQRAAERRAEEENKSEEK